MLISPRKLVNWAACFAGESCIEPIMIESLVEGRSGIGVTVSVAPKRTVADAGPHSPCVFWAERFMRAWWSCCSRPWFTV